MAGGNQGPGTQTSRLTNQCHDITVFPDAGLAAGACSGNGILLNIADPVHPVRLDAVTDKNFAYWHSATFNNDGTKVIFTDEWGGGTRPRCRPTDPPTWGADAIFDVVDRKLRFGGYYKMPAPQTDQENCVAHNGSLIPVPGRDIMVQAWYQGGVSVFDFTDSSQAGRDRLLRPRSARREEADHRRVLVDLLVQRAHLRHRDRARARRLQAAAERVPVGERDRGGDAGPARRLQRAAAAQASTWPATSAVARAYLDQLTRTHGVAPERAAAIKTALERADRVRGSEGQGRGGGGGAAEDAGGAGGAGCGRRHRPRRRAAEGAGRRR